MVEVAGRADIPVAPGARAPLRRRLVISTFAHGSNGLGDVEFPPPKIRPVEETATEIIHRIASGGPGEVSIVAVGPLTNVAAALLAYPSLARQIREIVLMGGSLSGGNMTPAAEFNMYVDPEAASIVFRSGVPVTMVGLDVTRKCTLTEEHVVALEAGSDAVSRTAARINRNALERSKRADWGPPVMHDPLAVATSSTGPSSACRSTSWRSKPMGSSRRVRLLVTSARPPCIQRRWRSRLTPPKSRPRVWCPTPRLRWKWTRHAFSNCSSSDLPGGADPALELLRW